MPSRDVERDLALYTGVMGAGGAFAIEAFGTRRAGGTDRPRAPPAAGRAWRGDAPVLVYRMCDLDTTMAELERRGLPTESRFGIPHRPCATFRAPGGQRLAVYELTRPEPTPASPGPARLRPRSGRGDRLAGPSAAPSPASGQPPDPSARRDQGDRQDPPSAEEHLDPPALAEMVGHEIIGRSRSCSRPLGGAPRGRAPAHRDAR
jgi:hypothetical protein